ncbi:MAG: site-specific DNA-methyltransferase [Acetobacteraceae bacterium]
MASAGQLVGELVGPHRLYCGDCLEIMPGLPAESIDVVVTSPPYNLGIAYSRYGDRREETEYLDWMLKVAGEIRRVLRPDGSFFLNITGSSAAPWLPFELIVRLRGLFALQNHISWVKSIALPNDSVGHFKPVPGERFLHRNHEHIFHLTQHGAVRLDRLSVGVPFKDKSNIARRGHLADLRCRGDTWFIPYPTVRSKAQKFCHPGTFPVELPRWCIRLHGKPGARVLDPFMGTGTTLLAASLEGAEAIGIDLDDEYVATARARLAQPQAAA